MRVSPTCAAGAVACVVAVASSCMRDATKCHGPDWTSEVLVNGFKSINSSADSVSRKKLSLPIVPPSEIAIVTDPKVCARAVEAADSVVAKWNPSAISPGGAYKIYVIRIGTSHAIVDLTPPTSHYAAVLVFGPRWEYRGTVMM